MPPQQMPPQFLPQNNEPLKRKEGVFFIDESGKKTSRYKFFAHFNDDVNYITDLNGHNVMAIFLIS